MNNSFLTLANLLEAGSSKYLNLTKLKIESKVESNESNSDWAGWIVELQSWGGQAREMKCVDFEIFDFDDDWILERRADMTVQREMIAKVKRREEMK